MPAWQQLHSRLSFRKKINFQSRFHIFQSRNIYPHRQSIFQKIPEFLFRNASLNFGMHRTDVIAPVVYQTTYK